MTFVSTARCPAGSALRRLSCAALATVLGLGPPTESHHAGAALAAQTRLPGTGPLPPSRPEALGGAPDAPPQDGQAPAAQPGDGPADAAPARKPVPAWGPPEAEEETDLPGRAPLPPPRPAFRGDPAAPPEPEALPQTTLPPDAQPKSEQPPGLPSWWPFGRQTPPAPGQEAEPTPSPGEPAPGRRGKRQRIIPTDAEVNQCVARLRARGAEVERIAPIVSGGCGIPLGVRLSQLPGDLPLSVPAVMTCALAEKIEVWVATVVRPTAKARFGSRPTKLLVGPTYQCRTMNHQPGAKLSEHAFGNAMDVAGFEFDAHATFKVSFKAPRSEDGAFQAEIRGRACELFDTVLGPGADPFHSTHLHVDLRNRGPGRHICR